jgi:hypothetical protein
MSPFGHDDRCDTVDHPDGVEAAIPWGRQSVLVAEQRMKVALVLVVGTVVLIALVALAELLGVAANRLLGGKRRRARRRGRGGSSPDVWVDAREARRDAEVLQSRPDIGTSWTSWERRGRRGR